MLYNIIDIFKHQIRIISLMKIDDLFNILHNALESQKNGSQDELDDDEIIRVVKKINRLEKVQIGEYTNKARKRWARRGISLYSYKQY